MNSVLNDSPLNAGLFKATRWDELQHFAKISIDIANVFNTEGVDVHFLNRLSSTKLSFSTKYIEKYSFFLKASSAKR